VETRSPLDGSARHCPPNASVYDLAQTAAIAGTKSTCFAHRRRPLVIRDDAWIDAQEKRRKPMKNLDGVRESASANPVSGRRDRFTVTDGNTRAAHAGAKIAHLIE